MKKAHLLLRYFAWFFISVSANSQPTTPNASDYSKIVEVLPPSPNAASLGKYGGIDVGLSSGAVNINLPVYKYVSSDIGIPISLTYTTYGFKVDEMASRVGTGWSLNAGGVITRTLSGAKDESAQRVSPIAQPVAWSPATVALLKSLAINQNSLGDLDDQPDLFSFNFDGFTGRFVLDSNLNPVQLSYSNLKIEKDFSSSTWNFKITTDQGVEYYFGGDSAREVTMKISGGDCANGFPELVPTAWYLKKVIHPNNDSIVLSYAPIDLQYHAGLSQTVFATDGKGESCPFRNVGSPSNLGEQFCETIIVTDAVLLQEINSSRGGKVKFIYTDRKDNGKDKLLSSIEVYQPGQSVVLKLFSFDYVYSKATSYKNSYSLSDTTLCYRPFLLKFQEESTDGLLFRKHEFTYNDLNSLPPRLSYSQDHYGYFNGKINSNLVPLPENTSWQTKLPDATANRDVDPAYAKKGLLATITYPTGGKDSIVYEGNQVYKTVTTYPTETSVNAIAYKPYNSSIPPGIGVNAVSGSAAVSYNQQARLVLTCNYTAPDHNDPVYSRTVIVVTDENDNSTLYTENIAPSPINMQKTLFLLAGHSYKITSNTYGYNVSGGAILYYTPGVPTIESLNVNTGGVRILKAITTDVVSSKVIVKKYLYERLTDPGKSSSVLVPGPKYDKELTTYQACNEFPPIDPANAPFSCDVQKFFYLSMYSNSLTGLSQYSAPVSYGSVIESYGENFENGGIEHIFRAVADAPPIKLAGEDVLGIPNTSNAAINGKEVYQHIFKKDGKGIISVKKTFIDYKEDTRKAGEIKAYIVNQKYNPPCVGNPDPTLAEEDAFDLYTFSYLIKWLYIDTIRTWTYDNNGQNYTEELSVSEYNNPAHALPTKEKTFSSDGSIKSVTTSYPQDLLLTGIDETARQALVNKNKIGTVLQQLVTKDATQLYRIKSSYNIFTGGLVLKQADSVQTMSYPIEERRRFYNYNNYGKLLEQSKTNDIRLSYIWNDLNTYPVAQVTNAIQADLAYTSFEDDSKGNWAYTNTSVADPSSPTGRKCYTFSNSITRSGLNATATYIVSYWKKSGTVSVNGTTPITGKSIDGWTYYEHKVANPADGLITVSGSNGTIDELRLYPVDAQMTTYTYDPLVGMTSQCDLNNRVTYYEYDGLQRLKVIRDQDRNIIKNIQYNYASGCGPNCIVLPMQTFNNSNTISYPVGVFNVNKKLLGNASNQAQYISLWNSDTADQHRGTLTAGVDSMHFNLAISNGITSIPTAVTGCRYFQYDLAYNKIDGIRNGNAAYVDFGDGFGFFPGKDPNDTAGIILPPNTYIYIIGVPYFIHTYPDNSQKTLTFYHNDGNEFPGLDNGENPATSLTLVKNIRGNFPQNMLSLGASCFQQSSALTVSAITNWNSINTITQWGMGNGDNSNPCKDLSYAQDFMSNNKGLTRIITAQYGPVRTGYRDTTFKISRLKSDWNTYFTQLQTIEINDDHWSRENLSGLKNLKTFWLSSTTQNHQDDPNSPFVPIPSSVVDNAINQIAAGAGQSVKNGQIAIGVAGTTRTSASDSSVTFLKSKGWEIIVNGITQ